MAQIAQSDLTGLIEILLEAVLREIENDHSPNDDAADPAKDSAASGVLHGHDQSTPDRPDGK
jgi:hypothetical protein